MKDYMISVSYIKAGYISVKAESAEEAIRIANEHIDECPLCSDETYIYTTIDGSYEIVSEPYIVETDTQMYEKGILNYCPEKTNFTKEDRN